MSVITDFEWWLNCLNYLNCLNWWLIWWLFDDWIVWIDWIIISDSSYSKMNVLFRWVVDCDNISFIPSSPQFHQLFRAVRRVRSVRDAARTSQSLAVRQLRILGTGEKFVSKTFERHLVAKISTIDKIQLQSKKPRTFLHSWACEH